MCGRLSWPCISFSAHVKLSLLCGVVS